MFGGTAAISFVVVTVTAPIIRDVAVGTLVGVPVDVLVAIGTRELMLLCRRTGITLGLVTAFGRIVDRSAIGSGPIGPAVGNIVDEIFPLVFIVVLLERDDVGRDIGITIRGENVRMEGLTEVLTGGTGSPGLASPAERPVLVSRFVAAFDAFGQHGNHAPTRTVATLSSRGCAVTHGTHWRFANSRVQLLIGSSVEGGAKLAVLGGPPIAKNGPSE
ncbi:hypothetical protein [Natrinema longum]|uniref:Uncharacterized protein n=1 Tax=Natrinema longum TaxID=370324 RepID=A0A8A2UCX9_9EURY|nr:hypothetical protein [Natrinema longum]MBZ6496015.1 hypothetical protein [Natrinema longum]QSW86055.1 hypothetical protein J0X27_04265 [Natrinema longum]